jgi:hypothetical protein
MDITDALVRKFRTQLAMTHECEIPGAFAFRKLLKQDRGRTAADVPVRRFELFNIARIPRTAARPQLAAGRELL